MHNRGKMMDSIHPGWILGMALFAASLAQAQPGPVTLNPAGGTFFASTPVVFTCPTSGAVIHYTTNGAVPSASEVI